MNAKPFFMALLLFLSAGISHAAKAQEISSTRTEENEKLTSKQIENLFAFTRVYGFVKYFYPLQKKEKINWSHVAAAGSQRVLNANSDEELKDALDATFQPIAPLLQIHNSSTKAVTQKSGNRYYYNLHQGLGQDKADLPFITRKLSGLYKSDVKEVNHQSYLNLVEQGRILPTDSLYSAQLTEELHCSLPLVLTKSSYRQNKAYKQLNYKYQPNLDEHQDRIAAIVIFWNVLQHFHPYLDNAADWDNVFVQTMQQLSASMTTAEFMRAARTLATSLNDGHAYLASTNKTGIYKKPTAPVLETAWVENKLVVSKVNIENTALLPGDIIQKAGAQEAAWLMNYTKGHLSNSNPENYNLLAAQSALGWLSGTTDTITMELIDSSGNAKHVVLNGQGYQFKAPMPAAAIRALEGGVYYVNTSTVSAKDMKENLHALQQAKGIVFDMRGRPSGNFIRGVLPYLIEQELETGNWSIPHYTFPDQKNVHFEPVDKWSVKPNGTFLPANKVFLIGHNTQSYGETCAEIIDHYKVGILMGGPTAGTNGDINFSATGQLQFVWTGMKVLKRDGSPFHGVGVIPTLKVQPLLQDIRQGRDTQVEAAVEYLQQSL